MAYAAPRVVMRPEYAEVAHTQDAPADVNELAAWIDWRRTHAIRERLTSLGFGIAEAMDTAQRSELGWASAEELMRETGATNPALPFIAGAGVDHVASIDSLGDGIDAVVRQARTIRAHGGEPILLSQGWIAERGLEADAYVDVYRAILDQLEGPVWIHWLGAMFAPALEGYFPEDSLNRVMALDREKVCGVKLSLLNATQEVRLRAELTAHDQVVMTGDDFHYSDLILGNEGPAHDVVRGGRSYPVGDFSHALLGAFDGVAEPASVALRWLAQGDRDRYSAVMRPTEDLARHVFGEPTRFYKAGLAFLAYLIGDQPDFQLMNHLERERDAAHYVTCARLASSAGVIRDAGLSADRLRAYLADGGIA